VRLGDRVKYTIPTKKRSGEGEREEE